MIKVRIRPFISGSVDWFPPNIVIPGPESDVIWWIVTNFVVICAVTFFIMKRSILLFTTLFFTETLNHLVVFDKAAVMTNVSLSPPLLFLPDRFILFCLLVLIMVSSREPQYVVLHAVNTLIDSQLTDRVKVISYTEKAIPLLLSTSRVFYFFVLFFLVLMIWYTVYIQLSLNFSWELNLKKIIYLLQRNRALLQSLCKQQLNQEVFTAIC